MIILPFLFKIATNMSYEDEIDFSLLENANFVDIDYAAEQIGIIAPNGMEMEDSEEEEEEKDILVCRACQKEDKRECLVAPCGCRGSQKFIHRDCLDEYRLTSKNPRAFYQCIRCSIYFKIRKSFLRASTREQSIKYCTLFLKEIVIPLLLANFALALVGYVFTCTVEQARTNDTFTALGNGWSYAILPVLGFIGLISIFSSFRRHSAIREGDICKKELSICQSGLFSCGKCDDSKCRCQYFRGSDEIMSAIVFVLLVATTAIGLGITLLFSIDYLIMTLKKKSHLIWLRIYETKDYIEDSIVTSVTTV
jgi:hypothetical protein